MPSTDFQNTFPLILILLIALMLVTMPANAQNPIANAYFCRMRCDASFNLCVNQMSKSFLQLDSPHSIMPTRFMHKTGSPGLHCVCPFRSGYVTTLISLVWLLLTRIALLDHFAGCTGTDPIGRSVQRLAQCEGVRRVCYCWC